ncbi:MAG: hypothetical protein DCC73_07530 [Proteobacteria bacterium]|nr:MAG: hypothetical protein DCC73_07530 [Pseudomonadota bacterium]
MAAPSIKRRMLVILLGIFAVVWMSVATITFMNVRREVRDVFDAQLAQAARVLATLVRDEVKEFGEDGSIADDALSIQIHDLEPDFMFQVLLNNTVVMRSQSAPLAPIWDRPGYKSLEESGNRWRVLRYQAAGNPAVIIVGGRRTERTRLVQSVAIEAMWPLLLALPVLALATLVGIRQALLPLRRVRDDIRRRTPEELGPVDTSTVPKEISRVIIALNALFARLVEALERERRFTSYAAHELRTPLAALKTQAHVALAARDDRQRQKAVENIAAGVERTAKLVEQLLTLARLDPPHAELRRDAVDLGAAVRDVVGGLRDIANANNITLVVDVHDGAVIEGDHAAITILARNLIDNALRYTPAGGQVSVTVACADAAAILTVSDSGPGIPEGERRAVFERFYRMVGSKAEGSGLGLSIVQRIAELHKAAIDLANRPEGGLIVTVRFPLRKERKS